MVQPYKSTATIWKKSYLLLSERSDFHAISRLPVKSFKKYEQKSWGNTIVCIFSQGIWFNTQRKDGANNATSIISLNKLHMKSVYSSKYILSYSIVCWHCYARNSIPHLHHFLGGDKKFPTPIFNLIFIVNLHPYWKWAKTWQRW